jgi:hypothetical protein
MPTTGQVAAPRVTMEPAEPRLADDSFSNVDENGSGVSDERLLSGSRINAEPKGMGTSGF